MPAGRRNAGPLFYKKMDDPTLILRHLTDLARRAEKQNTYQYSGFLSPAEQESFRRNPPGGGLPFSFAGGFPEAERRILICGSEDFFGYRPEPPLAVLVLEPAHEKYAEALTHRDYLGALMSLGLKRDQLGDIVIQDKTAYLICLEPVSDYIRTNLTEVRRTSVRIRREEGPVPALEPRFAELELNVASERLDAVVAAFCGLARGKADQLFAAEKVFVNGIPVTDRSRSLKEGERFSVRGFGKAVYDGIAGESRKGRLFVRLRKYI